MVIVRLIDEPSKLTVTQVDPRARKLLRGVVLATGCGAPGVDGITLPMSVRVGEVVFFGPMAGMTTNFAGQDVRLMRETDCVAAMAQR